MRHTPSRCSATRANTLLSKLALLICLACAYSSAYAQSVAWRVVKGIDHFQSIIVAPNINVTLVMDDETALLPTDVARRINKKNGKMCVVKGEPSVVKAVDCHVENGTLSLSAKKFKYRRSRRIDIYVLCDSTLRLIHGTSGGNIQTRGCLRLNNVVIKADFAEDIHLAARAQSVRIIANNHSSIRLTGKLNIIDASLLGASKLNTSEAEVNSLHLTASNECQANITANNSCAIVATGGCKVTLTTNNSSSVMVDKDDISHVRIDRK